MRLQRLMRTAAAVGTTALATTLSMRSEAAGAEHAQADCSMILSGAKSGTLECADNLTAVLGISENESFVGFSSKSATRVTVAIKFRGAPTTKTYRSTDPDATQGITLQAGTNTWLAEGSKTATNVGSYALTISSVKEVPFARGTKGYEVHGTLTATLQADADTGAKGTITLSARSDHASSIDTSGLDAPLSRRLRRGPEHVS